MKLVLRVLVALIVLLAIAAAWIVAPYSLRVQHFAADPRAGYGADFYLYVSSAARRRAQDGELATILVQPNNSGSNSDDAEVHLKDAWWTCFGRHRLAEDLGVVLLVPAFVRPAVDWHIYTHALDRDALTTQRVDLARPDLQLIAMLARARAELAAEGFASDERILIQGFSASGMFANRFTALHPGRVKGAAIGSPGGWPIAPLAEVRGLRLDYPAGIADLETLTGSPFDVGRFCAVPQLFVMGSLDDNDSLDFGDGWDEEQADALQLAVGSSPLERWDDARAMYAQVHASAEFLLVEGVGHERRKLQQHSTDFFRRLLGH